MVGPVWCTHASMYTLYTFRRFLGPHPYEVMMIFISVTSSAVAQAFLDEFTSGCVSRMSAPWTSLSSATGLCCLRSTAKESV